MIRNDVTWWSKPDVITAVSAAAASANSAAFVLPGDLHSVVWLVDVTTASGTSPTMDLLLQTSPDDGTTYYVTHRFAQITAVGVFRLITPLFADAGNTGTTATNANSGNSATITLTTSGALSTGCPVNPRFVRFRYVVGGTNPSFSFTVDAVGRRVGTGLTT